MIKRLIICVLLALTAGGAEEFSVPLKGEKRPNNHPANPSVVVAEGLDLMGFYIMLEGERQVGVRVRNARHKRGPSSISIDLGNSDLVVQRVDLLKPVSAILALGDGEHLIESFRFNDTSYQLLAKVQEGKLDSSLIVRKTTP